MQLHLIRIMQSFSTLTGYWIIQLTANDEYEPSLRLKGVYRPYDLFESKPHMGWFVAYWVENIPLFYIRQQLNDTPDFIINIYKHHTTALNLDCDSRTILKFTNEYWSKVLLPLHLLIGVCCTQQLLWLEIASFPSICLSDGIYLFNSNELRLHPDFTTYQLGNYHVTHVETFFSEHVIDLAYTI